MSVVENSDVLFYCSATGIPKPVIVWKKLDGQIPAERYRGEFCDYIYIY